jgi:type VI protein secretion system component VasF
MKPVHRLLILLIPALLCGLSGVFLSRADRKLDRQMDELHQVRSQQGSGSGATHIGFSKRQEHVLSAARATRKSKSFWVMACGFAAFFLVLAVAFSFYESRHRRRRDELIASFVADDAPNEETQ